MIARLKHKWLVTIAAVAMMTFVASGAWANHGGTLGAPTLACGTSTDVSIDIVVTAASTGAPAGFSVQWMEKEEYDANGWPVDSTVNPELSSFCKASFSGVPGDSKYNLGPNGIVTVNIGDNLFDDRGASAAEGCAVFLTCGTEYVFRSFAHNVPGTHGAKKSAFSATITCTTGDCDELPPEACTLTQGYWKTHGPIPTGNNQNEWPVNSLTLGTVAYTDLELLSILNKPAAGNGLIALAHQLIAVKLNIANGADGSSVAAAVAAADALIGGLVVPPVGSGFLHPSATRGLTTTLTSYNEGAIGPGHCDNSNGTGNGA